MKPDVLERLLQETGYNRHKTEKIVKGFGTGFKLEYVSDRHNLKQTAANLPFTVGDHIDLWNKVMKEVKLGRYAGPFDSIPFKNFIQSPIGLVPKDKGKDSRLIFHLSHPRTGKSVNSETLDKLYEYS